MDKLNSPTLAFAPAENSLRNQFLLAMPSLKDSLFARTVTYICDHNEDGAMGLILNQPLDLNLGEVLSQLNLTTTETLAAQPILCGGPMQMERGFVLHSNDSSWDSTMAISDKLSLTASLDILEAIAAGHGPKKSLFILGYAGWGPGQLEQELEENSWLTLAGDSGLIFDTPTEIRWQMAAQQLGVDLNLVSPYAGHA